MKTLLIAILFSPSILLGQEKKIPPFLNEYIVGANYAMVSNNSTSGKVDFLLNFK